MECAIGLFEAVSDHAESSIDAAFKAYDAVRRVPCQIVQHNADFFLGGILTARGRRMSITTCSDDNFGVPDFWLIFTPRWLR